MPKRFVVYLDKVSKDFETGKTKTIRYYFTAFVRGVLNVDTNKALAAVVDEENSQKLLDQVRERAHYDCGLVPTVRPVTWIPHRFRSASLYPRKIGRTVG